MYRERQRLINEAAESPGSSLGRESTSSQITAVVTSNENIANGGGDGTNQIVNVTQET